jgi:hypothetical protein
LHKAATVINNVAHQSAVLTAGDKKLSMDKSGPEMSDCRLTLSASFMELESSLEPLFLVRENALAIEFFSCKYELTTILE